MKRSLPLSRAVPRTALRTTARTALRAAAVLALATAVAGCSALGSGDDGGSGGSEGAKGGGPSFTVAAAGDVLIHPPLIDQAAKDAKAPGGNGKGLDFGPLMAGVQPVISKADLAICHMEPVIAKKGGPYEGFPNFQIPPDIAGTLKDIGYDTCSTASNHSIDHGPAGVKRTLDTLDEAGLKHTGSARTKDEAETPLIVDVKGVKVAQISFAFGFVKHEVPADKPWLVNKTSFKAIAAAERAAREAGADVVILSIHWGREHQPEPSTAQMNLAKRIAEKTGINLVIGHHAHVVQPMEKVGGTWFAYGLGNQVARHEVPSGTSEEGVIGWFTFTKRAGEWDVKAQYVPTFVDTPPDPEDHENPDSLPAGAVTDYRLLNPAQAVKDGKGADGKKYTQEQLARYRLAFDRTQGTMLNRGAEKDGLTPLQSLPE
ncbi:CapA family protein [Streptomyces sp. JV176]|uniref:CapA family protein n=1 Tax=Streptomyces sp. JV176 TaxID=858630 RepID=UPI002E759CE2|nr:CapA family protein [Streptomyces sp. JV176]MEE1800673.1 CapA family protein [Streptomyces sp. JV176]